MNKQEVIELLKKNRVVYFATVNKKGEPRVRPFSIVKIKDGKIYIFTSSHKEVYKEMKANPNVEFCVMNKNSFIRVRGTAIFEEDPEVVNKFLDENEGYKKLYKDKIENLKLFFIEHGEIHIFKMEELFNKTNFFAFNL